MKPIDNHRWIWIFALAAVAAVLFILASVWIKHSQSQMEPTSYRTVTEIEDWGAVVTKVILHLGRTIPKDSVAPDTFQVHVVRSDPRLESPFLEEGDRQVTKAYVSDREGNPADRGKDVVLELRIGPYLTLGSALNHNSVNNAWIKSKYTITQKKDIMTKDEILSNLVIETFAGDRKVLVDEFTTGAGSYDGVELAYASYAPKKDGQKHPLIVWLHGSGEGGQDPTIPLAANKAAHFASERLQAYFGGAHVLVPQSPTLWMDGAAGIGDGTSKYEFALMALIRDYTADHKDVDDRRIYIGGNSSGGYMTMVLARDYPDVFAAAFPVCEALPDTALSDGDIRNMTRLPIWFTAAESDSDVFPELYTTATSHRLVEAGGKQVVLSLFDDVHDTTGLYKDLDGNPFEYSGHFSWIYVFNNECKAVLDGKITTLMEWLASHSRA